MSFSFLNILLGGQRAWEYRSKASKVAAQQNRYMSQTIPSAEQPLKIASTCLPFPSRADQQRWKCGTLPHATIIAGNVSLTQISFDVF